MTAPFQKIQFVQKHAVRLSDRFWVPRRETNRRMTLPAQYRLIEETGRLGNFHRAVGNPAIPFQGFYFNDSDVYKWLQAAVETFDEQPSAELLDMIEPVIGGIERAQQPDGYLNTYFMYERANQRWTNLQDHHELYCAGHFIEAATARADHFSSRLLSIAEKLGDHLWQVFGTEGRAGVPGHPEIELALVKLYRATGKAQYLELARRFLDQRGQGLIGGSSYHVDHRPFRDLDQLAGHAVRALYLCAGATEIYLETGEPALRQALERLWERMVTRQTYVSGGVGARYAGEAFGDDYELPNERAYAETCAAIASVIWNGLMFNISGSARYADQLEWTLYNAVLPGISLDGQAYFYVNPLASFEPNRPRRQAWYDCACCPTNIVRLLAELPGYFYGANERGLWIHLYAQSQVEARLGNGQLVRVRQSTSYPWDGEVEIEILEGGSFELHLRIPGWAKGQEPPVLRINESPADGEIQAGSYVCLDRTWKKGDFVRLDLAMPVRYLESHPNVLENAGRVAVARGPILYCLEGVDHPGVDLRDLIIHPSVPAEVVMLPDLLGGIVQLRLQGAYIPTDQDWNDVLHRPIDIRPASPEPQPFSVTAIPYYAWANRDPGQMLVWIRAAGT